MTFQACFHDGKHLKNSSRGSRKPAKIDPEITSELTWAKDCFAISSMRKLAFTQPRISISSPKSTGKVILKRAAKKKAVRSVGSQKNSQNCVQKSPLHERNPNVGPQWHSCRSHGVPRCPQGACKQGVKMVQNGCRALKATSRK